MNSSKSILTIDLNAICANYKMFQTISKSIVGASVKANCYGLGIERIVPSLYNASCRDFFTANCDEGIMIRKILGSDANIYVLSGAFYDTLSELRAYNLTPVLNHLDQLFLWQEYAIQKRSRLACLLHFDTGMNRLGVPKSDVIKIRESFDDNLLDLKYIISHLASAEEHNNPSNIRQLEQFQSLAEYFPAVRKSLCNSSGAFLGAKYHFDLLRPGAGLYGINPTPYMKQSRVQNVVKLLSPIIQIKKIKAGESIGYNSTYTAGKDSIIATIPIGYADGLPLPFSTNGLVFINDLPIPIVGKISMDFTTIDVSAIPSDKIFLGQQVEILGSNINIDKLANLSNTIAYKVLTDLGNRFEKIYT